MSVAERRSAGRSLPRLPDLRAFSRLPLTLRFGIILVLFWAPVALLADIIAPFPPNAHNLSIILQPPSREHWLGTDNYGRDVLSRVIHGTRIDLQMGILAALLPFILGTTLGAIAGHFGGGSTR